MSADPDGYPDRKNVIRLGEEWEAAGRPGGTIPHEIVMAEFEAAWRSRGGSDS